MLPFAQSLCHRCAHLRLVTSARDSVFLLCRAPDARTVPQKYPPQPVSRCGWFAPRLADVPSAPRPEGAQ